MGYFYADSCEQYIFFRMPKELFTLRFAGLSTDAKLLYGLLLDRMSLSRKNRWIDELRRVYVLFSRQDAMDALCCCREKAVKLFAELEKFHLIEEHRQGGAKCNLIYVLDFHSDPPPKPTKRKPPRHSKSSKAKKSSVSSMGHIPANMKSEKPTSYFLCPGTDEVGNSDFTI